ncbi:MAG: Ca-activated chloride channel [Acidobacteriota bacterium]|jgi:Ca-activated chloride channel family protein|nr:Ca-activated chloride channel [Acidobacteriota bacterium]
MKVSSGRQFPFHACRRGFKSKSFLTLSLLACLLTCATNVLAQRNDEDEVVRVNSDLVVLNVTVTDKQGLYIHKLSRLDFKIFEDGREQQIGLFSVEETPFAAAILLDTSGSMETRLTLARAAAIRFLEGLREEDVASVYHFDSDVEQLQDFSPGRDLPPLAYSLSSKGMTTLNDAVLRASKDLALRPEKRRAIIVLSDGMDTKSGSTAEKALNAALSANATIYSVDMSDPLTKAQDRMVAAGALKNYALKSGGRYVSSPGGQALDEAFKKILEELSNQYTLGYQPNNRTRDGRWRTIELKLSRPELNARTRNGYRAPKP